MKNFSPLTPIFIGGCPRSGSTMLGAILGESEHCFTTPETIFKQQILNALEANSHNSISLNEFMSKIYREIPFWNMQLEYSHFPKTINQHNVRLLIDSILRQYAYAHGKSRVHTWIDHTPPNVLTPLLLNRYYPNAKFIHLIRDPRAVASSALPLTWGPNTPNEFSQWWAMHIAHGLAMEQYFPERCLRVRYEDILYQPTATVTKICAFCELDFHPEMLKAQKFKLPAINAKQHKLVGKAPVVDRSTAWQHELHPLTSNKITQRLSDLIDLLGYESSFNKAFSVSKLEQLHWTTNILINKLLSPLRRKKLRVYRQKLRQSAGNVYSKAILNMEPKIPR